MGATRRVGWQHRRLKIPALWDRGVQGRGTRIAILDSGVADVTGLGRTTFEYLDADGNEIPAVDLDGHGTLVASVATSSLNGAWGIAPRAALTSYRVLDGGDSLGKLERALAAIARRDDIDVVLCAFTMDSIPDAIVEAIRALAMSGVVVVAAAGNDANATTAFPERTPNVVTVAGLTAELQSLPTARSGEWIDIAAPGEHLTVVGADDAVTPFGESSGAAAIVAGVCALMLGTRTGNVRRRIGMALDGLIRSTARPLDTETAIGAGLVQPSALLDVIEQGY